MSTFFSKVVHLFDKEVPKLEAILAPEIALLEGLKNKFSALDLTTAATTVTAGVASQVPLGNVVASGAAALKASAVKQGVEINDEEASLISQALTKGTVASVNAVLAEPVPAVANAA